jgi:hypothetical protein
MKVGDHVVIRHNPHEGSDGEDVLGVVVEYKAGAGFAGCDLAYVCYEVGGESRTLPFGTSNLEALTAESAERLVETYENRVAWLRRMAEELRKVDK